MKFLGILSKIGICLMLCAGLASADSLQLRNGRRLQGKYIGGTSTAIGFMSGSSVEYFATTDVLVIMFDSAADSSLDGSQRPSPMSGGDSSRGAPRPTSEDTPDTTNQSRLTCKRERRQHSVSISEGHSSRAREKMASELRTNRDDRPFALEDGGCPSWL
jgi:hypothetical protein